jgi:hypothetical protein
VPPTNAVMAQIFGVQYLSMLGGFVFFSHQVGSFLGAWLGGKLYDPPAATTWCGASRSRWACLPPWPTCRCAKSPSRAPSRRWPPHEPCRALAPYRLGGDAAVLALVFTAYLSPHLVVDLANRVWACF